MVEREPSNFSSVGIRRIVSRRGSLGESSQLLVVFSEASRRFKFPGGMQKVKANGILETPEETLVREVQEETGLTLRQWEKLLKHVPPGDHYHTQHWYFAEADDATGTLHRKGNWDGDEWLSHPQWISILELARPHMLRQSHRPLFTAICQKIGYTPVL